MTLRLDYLNGLLQEDKEKGIFRCKREMFTDPRLFDLEMQHIFEGNWLYLAHESQIPRRTITTPPPWGVSRFSSRATRMVC
ncbi:hypothetical protein [Pseudomonas sp. GWSMS-1]|uniref:hypothetical protein n=1 Tax=Pseudomonas sp. GWSMS-1 TaxID=3308997 RepID=UPI003CF1DFBF